MKINGIDLKVGDEFIVSGRDLNYYKVLGTTKKSIICSTGYSKYGRIFEPNADLHTKKVYLSKWHFGYTIWLVKRN